MKKIIKKVIAIGVLWVTLSVCLMCICFGLMSSSEQIAQNAPIVIIACFIAIPIMCLCFAAIMWAIQVIDERG